MLRLLVADKFPETKLPDLRSLGLDVHYQPEMTAETLVAALQGVHLLCVRSTQVTAAAIDAAKDLMLIVRVGAGTNNIDVTAASHRGIYVANCPGKNAIAVAELALGLLLALDRQIPASTQALRSGLWDKKRFSKADGIKGKSLGIVGWGRIGQEVGLRAKSFGMRVLVFSVPYSPEQAEQDQTIYCSSLDEICQRSDVISVHLPLTPQTRGLFDQRLFDLMKPGAIFLNTSRGEIHKEDDLLRAMKEKGLRCGLDVFAKEPEDATSPFVSAITQEAGFVGTPHIGASTQQAQLSLAKETIRIVQTFLQEGIVPNCVNLRPPKPAQAQLIVRHYNKVGVLAAVMQILRQGGLNIDTMSNTIFEGSHTAVAMMQLNRVPEDGLLKEIEALHEMIIQVTSIPLESPSSTTASPPPPQTL